MSEYEMFHAATKILDNRAEQYGFYDDNELMHYGRKGMKKGEHIFGDDEETAQKYAHAKAKMLAEKARREGHGPDDAATVMKKMQNDDEKILNTPLGNAFTPDMGNAMRPMYEGKANSVQITDGSSSSTDRIRNLSPVDARYDRKAFSESLNSAHEDFINNESKKQKTQEMLDKAKESGHGPEEHVPDKPNMATAEEVEAKKKEEADKKRKEELAKRKMTLLNQEVTNQTGAKPAGPSLMPPPTKTETKHKLEPVSLTKRDKKAASNVVKASNGLMAFTDPVGYMTTKVIGNAIGDSVSKKKSAKHSFDSEIDKHLYLIHGVCSDAINVNRDSFVDQIRTMDGIVDDDTVMEIKHSAHMDFDRMIKEYAKANRIPLNDPDVQRKFNTAYQSICGQYDDAVDEACKKGRYR